MSNDSRPIPSRIAPSGIGKSTLSFLLDLAFTVGMMFLLYYTVGVFGILNHNDYYPAIAEQTSYVEASGLLETKSEGEFAYYIWTDDDQTTAENYAYKKYIDVVWNYFMEVVPSVPDYTANVSLTSSFDGAKIEGFTGTVDPTNADYGRWVYANFFGYKESATENDFVPSVENDFTSIPVSGKDDSRYHLALQTIFYDSTSQTRKGRYVDATNHMTGQPKVAEFNSRISLGRYASTVPSFVAAPLIFFFLIPLFVPNGKTLGKLICGIAVIDFDGYGASKFQIVVRQAFITFVWMVLALPWQVVGMPLFMLLMLIDYMFHVMSKKSQSIHDKIAHTLAIDAKKSVWFASPEQEKDFVEEHPLSPIAKQIKEEEGPDAVAVATSAMIEAEEKILDLSTINKRREEARRITSFDEFEKETDAEFAKREEEAKARKEAEEAAKAEEAESEEEPVDPEAEAQAMKDLAALEGLSEEEAAALTQEGALEDDEDLDAFVDEKK